MLNTKELSTLAVHATLFLSKSSTASRLLQDNAVSMGLNPSRPCSNESRYKKVYQAS